MLQQGRGWRLRSRNQESVPQVGEDAAQLSGQLGDCVDVDEFAPHKLGLQFLAHDRERGRLSSEGALVLVVEMGVTCLRRRCMIAAYQIGQPTTNPIK
jgi:hypothetical protein